MHSVVQTNMSALGIAHPADPRFIIGHQVILKLSGGRMKGTRFGLLVVVLLFTAALASAQTFRGGILGTVTDTSGAVVAGANVKVHNTATGLERTTTTSAEGNYSITELPLGTYTLTISQTGFDTSVT